ncbi:MAG: hypothetical protein AUJ51_05180 [Elusimicrobia bacterium CG1_02_56_21]|nr:MAG: hypothetical protein AUJ51_05180 [Elusimicrobia bacterium CG1_02_56_21]
MTRHTIINTFFNLLLILAAFAAAAVFSRKLLHVYKVGRENVIKSFSIGITALFGVWALMLAGKFAVPEGRKGLAIFAGLLPIILIGFTTGCTLIAGLAGLDGGKRRFLAILLVGGSSALTEAFFPIGGKTIFTAVFLYGLGASILALQYPMEETVPVRSFDGGRTEGSEDRRALGGDLSPLPRPGGEDRADQ